jgi:hypothetical protein
MLTGPVIVCDTSVSVVHIFSVSVSVSVASPVVFIQVITRRERVCVFLFVQVRVTSVPGRRGPENIC